MASQVFLDQQVKLISDAVRAAVDGDGATVDRCMALLHGSGWPAIHGAMIAFAELTHYSLGKNLSTMSLTGKSSLNAAEMRIAVGFFRAWCAGYRELAENLFYDAVEEGRGCDVVAAALLLTSFAVRRALHPSVGGEKSA